MAIRLGFGEHFDPSVASGPVAEGRRLFLEAVVKVEPAVLQSLEDELLSLYEESVGPDEQVTWDGPPTSTESASTLEGRLIEWSHRYHLNESWVLDSALCTLRHWSRGRATRHFLVPLERGPQTEQPAFRFEEPAWNPYLIRRSTYLAQARRNFRRRLRDYVDAIEKDLRGKGWRRTPQKRLSDPLRHFEMLAHYQCQEWSHSEIAGRYIVGRRTVGNALNRAAELIGLTLRPRGRGGRPAKTDGE